MLPILLRSIFLKTEFSFCMILYGTFIWSETYHNCKIDLKWFLNIIL